MVFRLLYLAMVQVLLMTGLRFSRLAVGAGVRPIGPHQIRHLLASSLLDAGYGITEVAERLGHDPATLMRYYSRVNATRRRQAADHTVALIAPSDAVQRLDPAREPLMLL
jgi:hypothetical protein